MKGMSIDLLMIRSLRKKSTDYEIYEGKAGSQWLMCPGVRYTQYERVLCLGSPKTLRGRGVVSGSAQNTTSASHKKCHNT
jgi:hypothetical protein